MGVRYLLSPLVLVALVAACSTPETVAVAPGPGTGGSAGSLAATTSSGGSTSGSGGASPECLELSINAVAAFEPHDIVVVLDDSLPAGMKGYLAGVLEAAMLSDAPTNFIIVGNHGPGPDRLCMSIPGEPPPACFDTPSQGASPPQATSRIHYYDVAVSGSNAVCTLLDASDGTQSDQWGLHPDGWRKWLNPKAATRIIVLSDEAQDCVAQGVHFQGGTTPAEGSEMAALALSQLRTRAPNVEDDYSPLVQFHVVGGFDDADSPLNHNQGAVPGSCGSAGFGLQALAISTRGLRYSFCDATSLQVVLPTLTPFQQDPEFECTSQSFPQDVPSGYAPVFTGAQSFTEVDSLAQCPKESGYYYLDQNRRLYLCPTTCRAVFTEPGFLTEFAICRADSG